jgi:hypothetical protein
LLVTAILQILEIIALGILISLIVLPFVFRLLDAIAYILTLIIALLIKKKTLKESLKLLETFPNLTDKPIYRSDGSKDKVYQPNYVHSVRSIGINKKVGQPKPINNFETRDYHEDSTNNSGLYLPKQPITTNNNKILNRFHNVIVFYKRFWCVNQSGKEPSSRFSSIMV